MANRILRDWTCSETIDSLSESAELFFTRLIMKADDFGRFYGSPKLLKAQLYPLKDYSFKQIEKWRDEVVKSGVVLMYEVDGKKYLEIKDFNQRLRLMKSKFPEPRSNDGQMTVKCQSIDGLKRNEVEVEVEENNIISKDICQNPAEIDEDIPFLEVEEIKFSPVQEKKSTHEKIDFEKLLSFYNEMFDRRCRVIPNAVKQKFNARMRDGYTKDNIIRAMINAKKEKNHQESGYKWLTLEFFSRHDKLDIYGTITNKTPIKHQNSLPQNQEYRE